MKMKEIFTKLYSQLDRKDNIVLSPKETQNLYEAEADLLLKNKPLIIRILFKLD